MHVCVHSACLVHILASVQQPQHSAQSVHPGELSKCIVSFFLEIQGCYADAFVAFPFEIAYSVCLINLFPNELVLAKQREACHQVLRVCFRCGLFDSAQLQQRIYTLGNALMIEHSS